MADIVFVFGAGASAQDGCPVMGDFFKCADILQFHSQLGERFSSDWQRVNEFRQFLLSASVNSGSDIHNLESVFNAAEMLCFLFHTSSQEHQYYLQVRASLIRLIAAVLDATQEYAVGNHNPESHTTDLLNPLRGSSPPYVAGPSSYDRLIRWYSNLSKRCPHQSIAFITFNYDLGLEYSLAQRGYGVRYHLASQPGQMPPVTALAGIDVLKLHGSINWILDGTRAVRVSGIPDTGWIVQKKMVWPGWKLGQECRVLDSWSRIESLEASPNLGDRAPLIVPPSESKQSSREILKPVWQQASKNLAEARYVVICGYSMPRTDEFFRQFWTASLAPNKCLQKVFIADPDASQQFRERFDQLLGPLIVSGGRREYMTVKFDDMIRSLGDRFIASGGLP